MSDCQHCDYSAPTAHHEIHHMETCHPEVIAERLRASGASDEAIDQLLVLLAVARGERDALLADARILVEQLEEAWWMQAAGAIGRLKAMLYVADHPDT